MESRRRSHPTRFRRRLVITAAHCIIDSNGNFVAPTFFPGKNGASNPFGSQSVVAATWGGWYIPKCTQGAPGLWSDCMPEDWALLALADNFPSGHPGWLGYAWLGTADTQNFAKFSNGYPTCGGSDSPAGCTTCTTSEQPSATIRRNPNLDKRIDSFIFNLMTNWRASYP